MKKHFFLLLVLALCLSLCACGGNDIHETQSNETTEPSLDILGEWVSVEDNTYTITFQNDGTCFYTGDSYASAPTSSVVIGATITWDGTVSSAETTTSTETTAPETDATSYKYTFNPEVAIITVYTSTSTNYQVKTENGKVILFTVEGEATFVRPEDYEQFHAAFVNSFYAEGKDGRTELEFGTAYTIQDGLNMTATDYVIVENQNTFGFMGEQSLYLKVTLENISNNGIYIRQDGIEKDGSISLVWGSDVRANIKVKQLRKASIGGFIIADDSSTNGSHYFFKYEELGEATRFVGSGNHIYLKPSEQSECYLSIPNIDIESAKQSPAYATIKFDNYDFFCDLSALVKTYTDEPITDPTQEPTTEPTQKPTTDSTQKTTTAPTEKPTNSAQCGHSYKDATCTVPQTCSYCGATNGSALGHDYKDATCTTPKTCSKCGTTEGSISGHNYSGGNCSVCGKANPNETDNFRRILFYLREKQINGVNVTADDVANALGMDRSTVDSIFTSNIQRKGLGVRTPAEIQLEDGTYKQVKYLSLTPAGMSFNTYT